MSRKNRVNGGERHSSYYQKKQRGEGKNSVNAEAKAGCGGLIRGGQGEWLGGFSKKLHACDPYTAELWGIWEGLEICKQLGLRRIVVECDASIVLKDIQSGALAQKHPILRRIRRLINDEWQIVWNHVWREGNRCADLLARMALNSNETFVFWNSPPVQLTELLHFDAIEGPTTRVVHM